MRAGAGRRTRSRRGTEAAAVWGSARCRTLRAGATMLWDAARPRRASRVAVAAIPMRRRRQNLGRAGLPGQDYLPAPLHAGAVFTGDFDFQHLVAQRDIELECITVVADVLDDARQCVVPLQAFRARGDR